MKPWKSCPSCRVGYTRAGFLALPDPPRGNFQRDEDAEQRGLVLKNCACGSTIAVRLLKSNELAA